MTKDDLKTKYFSHPPDVPTKNELDDFYSNLLLKDPESLRQGQYIYALLSGGKVVYIGQTNKGPQRVYHHIGRIPFTHFVLIPTSFSQEGLNLLEANLIVRFKPTFNTSLPTAQPKYFTRKRLKGRLGMNGHAVRKILSEIQPAFLNYYDIEDILP